MRLSFVTHLAAMAIALAAFTHAATAAPCKTQGSSTVPELSLDLRDREALTGLRIAFYLGLLPKTFPMDAIAKIGSPCSRGKPAGLAKPVELFGENENEPPRWAIVSGEAQPYFFVAVMPKPGPAMAWWDQPKDKRGPATFKKGEWMSALVVIGKTGRRLVLAFFSQTPSDDRILTLVKEYEAGTRQALVGLDVENGAVAVNPIE